MPTEFAVAVLVATVALFVALAVAQRAGEHADRRAGRSAPAHRAGPLQALVDAVDRSGAAHAIRSRLGLSTLTRAERRAADQRAAAIARDQEARTSPAGAPRAVAPARLVVAGGARPHPRSARTPIAGVRSPMSLELLAGALGLAVVVAILVGIWPRESGGVLSATAAPSPTATPSISTSPVASPT